MFLNIVFIHTQNRISFEDKVIRIEPQYYIIKNPFTRDPAVHKESGLKKDFMFNPTNIMT